jgi:MFS family permease
MKNIDKNIFALGWVSFFTDMASSMITVLLPVFVVYILNEEVDKLGIVIAVATFVSYIFRIVFGYLSDR